GTVSFTWIPSRPGNWLFHCHDNLHTAAAGALDGRPRPTAAHHHVIFNHALEMMSGPVIGITVLPDAGVYADPEQARRRQLRLVARTDAGGTDAQPGFGFTLEGGKTTPPRTPPFVP